MRQMRARRSNKGLLVQIISDLLLIQYEITPKNQVRHSYKLIHNGLLKYVCQKEEYKKEKKKEKKEYDADDEDD